jgi:hypothetical protein
MFCTECGFQANPAWKFCPKCGTQLWQSPKPSKRPKTSNLSPPQKRGKKLETSPKREARTISRSDIWTRYRELPEAELHRENDALRREQFAKFLEKQIARTKNFEEQKLMSAWVKEIKRNPPKLPKLGPSMDKVQFSSQFDRATKHTPIKASKFAKGRY